MFTRRRRGPPTASSLSIDAYVALLVSPRGERAPDSTYSSPIFGRVTNLSMSGRIYRATFWPVPCPYGSHAGYFRQRGAESPRISLSRNNFSTGDQVDRNERWKWNGLRREDIAFLVKRNCSILSHEFCTKLKGIDRLTNMSHFGD